MQSQAGQFTVAHALRDQSFCQRDSFADGVQSWRSVCSGYCGKVPPPPRCTARGFRWKSHEKVV
jgi:hypothetical protein